MPTPLAVTSLLACLVLPWVLGFGQILATRRSWKLPVATLAIFALTVAALPLVQAAPELLPVLDRQPTLIGRGEVWRALTALFVHRGQTTGIVFNLFILLAIGAVAEQHFARRLWIGIYLGAGILTEFLALAWEPEGCGNSIAVFGLAGALSLLAGNPGSFWQSVARLAAFAAGAGLLIVHDIHGIGFWTGAVIFGVQHYETRRLSAQSTVFELPELS